MRYSTSNSTGRRSFLGTIGTAAFALPFLETFHTPAAAKGAGGLGGTKFAIFIYTNDGIHPPSYWPNGGETNFDLTGTNLESFQTGRFSSPHNGYSIDVGGTDFRDKMLILGPKLNGRDPVPGSGIAYSQKPLQHRAPLVLTGSQENINLGIRPITADIHYKDNTSSIDQLIARKLQGDSIFASLSFGIHVTGVMHNTPSQVSYYQGGAVGRMRSAAEAWDRTFGDFVIPDVTDPGALADARRSLRKHNAVTDFLHERFKLLNPSLGAEDKRSLDHHLDALHTVEGRTQALIKQNIAALESGEPLCEAPVQRPVSTDPDDIRTGADTEQLTPLYIDILVGALRCGMTKVGSLLFGYAGGGGPGGLRMPWLGFENAQHGLSHHGENAEKLSRFNSMVSWTNSQVAYLMSELNKTPYEDGTLLDHTTIFLFNRHGDGNKHENFGIPEIILGGTGGYFNMGRNLQLEGSNPTNVLISLAHSAGMEGEVLREGLNPDEFGVGFQKASGPMSGLRA